MYKVGQTWKNEKGESVTITEIYESRISKTINIRYSKTHDLGTYGNSVKEDRFSNVVEGMDEVKENKRYYINLKTKCCVSDNWCEVSEKMYNGWNREKQIK